MKVLVYGAGVIGSLMIHNLITAGNVVTVIARGKRKESMEEHGMCLHIGKKEYTDHPEILAEYDGEAYDAVFSVMQNQQQEELLYALSGIRTEHLVLVGNNMTSSLMEESLAMLGFPKEKIYFGFQVSGGEKHEEYTEAVTFGKPSLTLGQLHNEPKDSDKAFFRNLFGKTTKLEFTDDMDGWYKCHMAFILPIAYISYAHHCNLRECSMKDMKNYMKAGTEVYDMYQSLGIKIRPKGDEKNTKGIRCAIMTFSMWFTGKTKMGELAISNHCRNAVSEMEFMESQLEALRKKADAQLPVLDSLKKEALDWKTLHEIYG